jgi:hypothetical protein
MQNRKYIGMVVSAVLVLLLLLVFTDPWSTVRNEGKKIHLGHPEAIDRIVLTDGFDTTLLVRTGPQWQLFGEEEVNPVAVENLLFAASKLQISSILSDQSSTDFPKGRLVRFYSGERMVLGFELAEGDGQYMVRPLGSSRTYFVTVSGFTGLDLTRVFSTSANHYRQHLLIDLLPSEISRIDTELAGGESFRFVQDTEGGITCTALNEHTVIPATPMDDLAVRLLFSYFTAIRYEMKSGIMKGELQREDGPAMLARLTVVPREGEGHTLEIYPMEAPDGGGEDLFRALVLFDHEPEALVVKTIYLDVLMRGLSHYF